MPEVSPIGGTKPRVQAREQVFVSVNQVLVRLWARSSLCLTERLPGSHRTSSMVVRAFSDGTTFRGELLCAEQE
jgi:hypothetical protein